MPEIWIVHCLYCPNGRSLIGVAEGSKKNANRLAKRLCEAIEPLSDGDSYDFAITMKKVKRVNEMVIDLT